MWTKHAIIFRLSNKIVQVIFFDNTQIILHSEQRAVTYVNKNKERLHFSLSQALKSPNNEMTKRLNYTKQILSHMLQGKQFPKEQDRPKTTAAKREEEYNFDPLSERN